MLSINKIRSVGALLFLCFCPSLLNAQTLFVSVSHPPDSFLATLEEVDEQQTIVLSQSTWFSPAQTDVAVFFLRDEEDLFFLPSFVGDLRSAVGDRDLVLVRARLDKIEDRKFEIQLNDLTKENLGIQYQGCVAALDLASVTISPALKAGDEVSNRCDKFLTAR